MFNTPIQEAFIVGSTVGMSAVGLKPIVEVQFADYIWPGLNQLFTEVSRSNYLSNGKWPVSMILRVPIGAYGSGGPYHSGSVESVVTNIRGIKVMYPSNGADLKGLMKAAYHLGNRHVPLQVEENFLRYRHDHILDQMLEQMGIKVNVSEEPFEPEAGAYQQQGSSHQHSHEHAEENHNDHTHGHSH